MVEERNFRAKFTTAGRHSGYQVELYHQGLKEAKALSAVDEFALEAKMDHQKAIWDKRWKQHQKKKTSEENLKLAEETTSEYQSLLEACEKILEHTLSIDDTVDWEALKRRDTFVDDVGRDKSVNYRKDGFPASMVEPTLPQEPSAPSFVDFALEITFFDTLFGGAKKKREAQQAEFEKATLAHQQAVEAHNLALVEHQHMLERRKKKLANLQAEWAQRKEGFEQEVSKQHAEIDRLKSLYLECDPVAVSEYCEMVLENSVYPFNFTKEVRIVYQPDTRILGIDYLLPSFDDVPNKESVRYVKSRDEFVEKTLSNAAKNKLYETVVYQITIRTIHEVLEADSANAIDLVSLNGWVDAINNATGHEERKCIVSVQSKKDDFLSINLQGISDQRSYKECFKSLKGVSGAKLAALAPVKPIIEFNKTDRRFRDHYDVASGLDDSVNLASMDWEDFEHLVREVFEKEFSANGGEVRVTQASRDGGVDAIAFDPDPIRGGKIVIQAKRYTNVVGVSAVRDLYGTVMNEGATKGILVTTAEYGPDAYSFASGKPITLLNGSNLLHLLEQHGHKAKIDIAEAKRNMNSSR